MISHEHAYLIDAKRVSISDTIVSRTCSDTAAESSDHVLIMSGVRVGVLDAWLKACGDL